MVAPIQIGAGINIGSGITVGKKPFAWWDSTYIDVNLAIANNNNSIFINQPGFLSGLGTTELSSIGPVMFSLTLNYEYDTPVPLNYMIGIGNHSTNLAAPLGNDANSYGFGTDGNVYYDGTTVGTGFETWGNAGDIIDIAINPSLNAAWIRINGGNWNNDPVQDPATSTGGIEIPNGPYYPAISLGATNGPSEFTTESVAQYGTPGGFTFIAGTEETGLMLNLDAGDPASIQYFGFFGINEWVDISGYNNNATFTAPNLQYQNSPQGYFQFDGTGASYATVNYTASMSPTSQISWETWAYSDTSTAGDSEYHWILRNGWEGAPWYHGINTTGQWELIINDVGYATTAGPQLTAGWHQIVGTYDGTNIRMYLDGAYAGTLVGTATGPITGYGNPTIIGGGSTAGSPPPNQQYWNGGISVIKMFNTQLSPYIISNNFETLRSRYGI